MIQETELINLSQEKKLILLTKYFEDEMIAKSITEILSPAELNNWISKNSDKINDYLRHKSIESGVCWKCGKKLSFFSCNGGDNWSIECLNCDILFDED